MRAYAFDIAKAVEVHATKRIDLVILLDLPVKRESIRDLQEGFVVLGKHVGSVFFLPLHDRSFGDA